MVEYITLGTYLVILLIIGVIFSRFTKNLSDFVRGGAQATWWMLGTSMLMGGISAFTFTGNASAAFLAGPTLLTIYAASVVALIIAGFFLAARFRQTRAYTGSDVIRARFGTPVEQFSGYLWVLLGPVNAAIQLWALSIFASSVFGFPLVPTIVVLGIIVIFYSASGGLWAVMATDFVQGIILFAITSLMAYLALVKIGGIGEFFSYFSDPRFVDDFKFVKESGEFPKDRFTMKWILIVFLLQFVGILNLGFSSKFLSVKDGGEAQKAAFWAAGLKTVGMVIWFIPPMVARFMYETEVMGVDIKEPATASYVVIASELLPAGLMGIMMAAMFSATMSSMDSGLNGQTSTIVRNLIPRMRERLELAPLESKTELFLCKLITSIIGVFIISISLTLANQEDFPLFDAYLIMQSVINLPLTLPLLAGLFIKRLPWWGFFGIVATALIPSVYSIIDARWLGGEAWTIQDRAMWVLVFGSIGTAICMYFYKYSTAEYRQRVKELFDRMERPIDYAKEVGKSRDYAQLRVLGNTTTIMGGLLFLFLLVPNTLTERLYIVYVAGFVVLVGVVLKYGAYLEKNKEGKINSTADGDDGESPPLVPAKDLD